MVPRARWRRRAARKAAASTATVVDVRSPGAARHQTILAVGGATARLFTVEENPRLCGWGAEIVSIVAEEASGTSTGRSVRITTPHIPLPAADALEDLAIPSVERIWVPVEMLIGGRWVPGSDGRGIDVSDPATGGHLATVADGSVDDGIAAVDAAAAALPGWAATAPRARAEVLRRAFELMTERAEDLARLIVLENGKALADARGEVAYAAEFFRWYAEEAVRAVGEVQTAPSGSNRILVLRQPIGVACW
jgi:hypothetical protein